MMNIFISVGFLCILHSVSWAQQACQSSFMDTAQMCLSGHTSGDSILMDFSPFESMEAPSCTCTIYIATGSRLEFNYVYSPGYYGCGSAITIVRRTMSTFRCLQGAESLAVTPGDSVTVQITRERDMIDSKYCYLLRSYQYSDLDRVPGSIIVVCSQPPESTTTPETTSETTTNATATVTHSYNSTTIPHTVTTQLRVTTNSHHELTSLPLTSNIVFTTALITNTTVEVTPENTTSQETTREHTENRDLAHFPWEIITPLSIIIFILIVVAIIIFKVRRRRYLKSTYKPAETRTTSWAFNQPSITVSTPKITQDVKSRIGKTDSGVYSTLGENDKRSTESVPATLEKYYKEVCIDDAIVESEARKQRTAQAQQEEEGLDNPGFEEDETVAESSSESRDISSSVTSSQSDITNFISKLCAADTVNQKYFLDHKDNSADETYEKNTIDTQSVSSYSAVTASDLMAPKTDETSSHLPIDTGYVIIDVMASI